MKIYRPLWNEGALLSPQQFQQQTEWESFRSAGASALASPFPWGVEKIEFNDSLLSSGLIQITQLRLWLEDGSLIDAQRSDLPPAPRELDASQLTGRDAVTVVIALPHMQPGISNVEQEGVSSERPLRYREEWVTLQDAFGSEEESIAVARFNFTIRFAHESNDSWKVCPVARLIRDGQNAWRQDLSFIPPVASFGASPVLHERLMLLNRQLRSRRQRLMTMRRESNERLADFAVADVSLFWLLNALNSHATVLAEYERFPSRPPEQVWAELARLAGSMLTFSLDHDLDAIPGYDHEEPAKAFPPLFDLISEHLRFRYGRRWQRKVRLLLVMGNPDDVQKAAPGLCHDLWQEGDGNVLIYGGDAQSLPDEIFLAKLKRLRSGQPVDGIIQVTSTSALPTDSERDAFLRCRQKADHLLGWQAPVWLWLTDNANGAQQGQETVATGVIFGPEGTIKEADKALTMLSQRLQKAGMAQILNNPAHNGLLQLSSRLQHELKASLTVLLSGLMQGSAAWRLRGVMFSPELAVAGTVPNTRLDTPTWKAVIDDCDAVSGRKLGFNWLKMLRLILLSLIVLWGAGTLLSLVVNRTQIYQAQETARQAADTAKSLAERLHTDSARLCELARKCLCECAKDIRVVTWYVQARLSRDGEKGLAEGLLLLVAMLTRYGQACHPQRPVARKAALEWLNSAKVIDALLLWPEVDRNDAGLTAGAINLLQSAVADWPEAEKPSFAGLCTALENRLARSGGMEALVPQNSSAQDHGREPAHSDSPQLSAVKSGRDLLDQAKLLSRWLSEQPQGWLASHRLIKTVRWDTVNQIPPLDSSGRTRLVPPKPEYRAQLKRLYLQKNWTELVEQASQMYCEGVNHFWFDLQWYLWQGLSHAGQPWDTWTDSVLCDLRLLLKRLPGLEGLAWNDGTPFADEVTTAWIAEKVNEEGLMYGDELATVVNGPADDVLLLESEAMEKGDTEGPEAALTWLQSRPGMDTPRHRWLIRLLMARVAEQYGRNEMALHLLGELTICAPQLTLGDWEPGLLFEIHARRLKLLRLKAGRSESDKARLMPEMESLIAGLIAIDPARAMVLCG